MTTATISKLQNARFNHILNQEARPMRRTLCKKYFERTPVEIWKLTRAVTYAVWCINGFYYGFELIYLPYEMQEEIRTVMVDLYNDGLIDEKGLKF